MKIIAITFRWILTLIVALAAIGPLGGIASAAPADTRNQALERAYTRAREHLASQRIRLDKANARADKVATWVSNAKQKGKNTAALETALSNFRTAISKAEASWKQAEATLTTHAGFDDTGKVTDATVARTTVESAATNLKQTNETLRQAYDALRKAINEWRRTNRDTPDPQVPAEE